MLTGLNNGHYRPKRKQEWPRSAKPPLQVQFALEDRMQRQVGLPLHVQLLDR
jgi:hypothetical protein